MKTKLLLVSVLALVYTAKSQNLHIPDQNFKNALISSGVAGDDLEVSLLEAENVIELDLQQKGLSDLSGIEAFVNLEKLTLAQNSLSSVDLSGNLNLKYLDCSQNKLSSLDLSQNHNMETLICNQNHITSLTVSDTAPYYEINCEQNYLEELTLNNPNLKVLNCTHNYLADLDVSGATGLITLQCNNNELVSLDLSMNSELEVLNCSHNLVYEICVSSAEYASSNENFIKDEYANWSEDCNSETLYVAESDHSPFKLYPNPVTGKMFIRSQVDGLATIFDSSGRLLMNDMKISSGLNSLELNLKPQVYFIKIQNERYNETIGFIVR